MNSSTLPLHTESNWQSQLRNVITSGRTLLSILNLEPMDVGYSDSACADFPIKVPQAFVNRMRCGDAKDPLLLQVLARQDETLEVAGYNKHPLREAIEANPSKGILHKYQGRALLIVTGGCAVNCRYCFRRHFPYGENQNSRSEWAETLTYLAEDASIEEVILSGGDPLIASDSYLGDLVEKIADISHIKRLRIHSRLPIVLPDRITADLIDAIKHPKLQTIMVLHCNHPNEIDEQVLSAMARLRLAGITLLNQSVLLAGINDSVDTLAELSEKLMAGGTIPYYLHLLDKVQGAAHFDTPEDHARQLVQALSARLSGYLVPKLVREVPGAPSKVSVQGTD